MNCLEERLRLCKTTDHHEATTECGGGTESANVWWADCQPGALKIEDVTGNLDEGAETVDWNPEC